MRAPLIALVLLLFALHADAQPDDGVLVEYSDGGFSEGMLVLDAPRVRIWRNGRIVFIRDGVWTARLSADRVRRLENDLARMPLLQGGTRYVDVKSVRPMVPHGGMSYIRFLHDGDETIVATRGRPFRGVWQRTIDRVRAEIPDSAEQWIPPEITFAVRKWDTARAGWEVVLPWPFGTLAGGTTSDPRVVAFLMQHSYRDESWRRRIEVNGELYQVYVTKVPQWLDPASMTGMVVLALASE